MNAKSWAALAAGVLLGACGSPPPMEPSSPSGTAPAASIAAPAVAPPGPPGVDSGPEAVVPVAASCRVATEALSCISAKCFHPAAVGSGAKPSGRLAVRIDFDAAGTLSAFEPEQEDPSWQRALECARGCVMRSDAPRACSSTIYLHVP